MGPAVLNAIGDDRPGLRGDLTTVDPGPDEARTRVRASGTGRPAGVRRGTARTPRPRRGDRPGLGGRTSRRTGFADINDGFGLPREGGAGLIRQVVTFN